MEIFLIKAIAPKPALIEDAGRKTSLSSKFILNNFVDELAKKIGRTSPLNLI